MTDHNNLKELQNLQIKILEDFSTFCEDNGLKFILFYGSLLGAVRHKGFIPWDYDIDTAMTRKEHIKLMKVIDKLPNGLTYNHVCYSDIDHAGLTRINRYNEKFGNVHIDIFILDPASKPAFGNLSVSLYKLLHTAKLSKNEKRILIEYFHDNWKKRNIVRLSKLLNGICGGSSNVEKLIYSLRVSKSSTQYITLEDFKFFPKASIDETILLPFGDKKFPCPKDYDQILKIMYGNYMEIPPEGKKWIEEEKESTI